MSDLQPGGRWIGASIRRKEDARLIRGGGRYLDDIRVADLAHAHILRSPHPHARILGYDTEDAKRLPGVLAVLTGVELRELVSPVPDPVNLPFLRNLPYYPLAVDRVRFEGEPVVAVVAEDPATAEDALELVNVEYDPLPCIATVDAGLADDAPLLYDEWEDNIY